VPVQTIYAAVIDELYVDSTIGLQVAQSEQYAIVKPIRIALSCLGNVNDL